VAPLVRKALLIGVEAYDDGRFENLPSCRADVWHLRQALAHPAIGRFDSVTLLSDPTATDMRQAIAGFLDEADREDLALLYISGHGTRLRHSSGEFFFVAKDTDFDRPAETAVSASFVNEQLEACRAPQKVTIIDACESGGFAVGLRTRDAKGGQVSLLQSRGVYVLSSSGVGEASYSGPPTASGAPTPSVFTHEIIEALRTGKADSDGDGKVSVEELFHYVNTRVRSQELLSAQVPVYSSIGVNSKIIIANVIAGAARRQAVPADLASDRPTYAATASGAASPSPSRSHQWASLLDYYQQCVRAESAETPLLRLSEHGDTFIYLQDRERILSGGEGGEDHVVLDDKAANWVRSAAESDDELRAGYPAVLLYGPQERPWREAKFAPLLMRRVAVVEDDEGLRLEPFGPVQPHRGLARACLGPEQADHLAATYLASWHAGVYAQMVRDIRNLLDTEFELPTIEELQPQYLAETLDQRSPSAGARNVAVLFRAPCTDKAVAYLLKDLDCIARSQQQVDRSALAALLPGPPAAAPRPISSSPTLVIPLPCNEAQQAVIASAMTSTLTVATGPPGTGKSQLVTNAVATAVSLGQTVLVSSTNNTAVDEVWQRCRRLMPGMLIRTGSRSGIINYAENEAAELTELRQRGRPVTNMATANATIISAAQRLGRVRAQLGEVAGLERALLEVALRRDHLAAQLTSTTITKLTERLGNGESLARWQRQARRCAGARVFAGWRRQRLLRRLGHAGEPTAGACQLVADIAAAGQQWALMRQQMAQLPDDAVLAAEQDQAEQAVHESSRALVETAVRGAAMTGRQSIDDLLQARQAGGPDWPAVKQVLRHVRGWAVTSLSARRFPPDPALFDLVIIDEASQSPIPQVIPLLFRAKRALIIGDPMQLPHITTITPDCDAAVRRVAGLTADWLEARQLSYRRHSAFHALERAAGGNSLLDEHYRCHPRIADVVNRLFYRDRLTVLTDTRSQKRMDRPPILWVPVSGQPTRPPSGGSWINREEAAKIHDCVAFLLKQLPTDATIGVVTPYKAQAESIANQWSDEPRVRVGTVHVFQGGERDAIVLGLVAGPQMPGPSVAWLEAQPNLWNVAISRARAHLIVVGNQSFWATRPGIGADLAASLTEPDEQPPDSDPLLQRLYEQLSQSPGAAVELAVTVNGYHADALMHLDGKSTALILDRSTTTDEDPARHLRLQYRRTELLRGPPGTCEAVRLAAWRLYEDRTAVPLLPGSGSLIPGSTVAVQP
jgi:hypothetical protein